MSAGTWPLKPSIMTYCGLSARTSHFEVSVGYWYSSYHNRWEIAHIAFPQFHQLYTVWEYYGMCLVGMNTVHGDVTCTLLDSPTPHSTWKWSDTVVCCPSSPSKPALTHWLNSILSCQTSSINQDGEKRIEVFGCWLSKYLCCLTWCPSFSLGASFVSCCYGGWHYYDH